MGWRKTNTLHQGNRAWAIVDDAGSQRAVVFSLADAQMVEAAPDLLSAARRASRELRLSFGPSPSDPDGGWSTPSACEVCRELDAAIAKTQGRGQLGGKSVRRLDLSRLLALLGVLICAGVCWGCLIGGCQLLARAWAP